MPSFNQVEVRPAEKHELDLLERAFGPLEKHAERLHRQNHGDAQYLIAWYEGKPVGHGLLKWSGATEEHIALFVNGKCPDVEDVYVVETMRSRSIGGQILNFAESLVRERGYTRIGLSVGVENVRAKALYHRLGYQETPLGEHHEHGKYVDEHGHLQTWEERCIYLIKPL